MISNRHKSSARKRYEPWARWRGAPFAPVPGFLLIAGMRKVLLLSCSSNCFFLTYHIRRWPPLPAALTDTTGCRIQSGGKEFQLFQVLWSCILNLVVHCVFVSLYLCVFSTWWCPLSRGRSVSSSSYSSRLSSCRAFLKLLSGSLHRFVLNSQSNIPGWWW